MVSEQVTSPCKIFKAMAMISGSLVFRAATNALTRTTLTFDGDDQLRNHGEHFGTSLFKHVEYSLDSQESVRVLLFSDAFEEDGQVMVVVQLLDFNFPVNFILRTVLNSNWKITSVIESSEFTGRNVSCIECSSSGLLRCWLFLWLL